MIELIFLFDNIKKNYLESSIDYLKKKFEEYCQISIISYNKDDDVLHMPNIDQCMAYVKSKDPSFVLTNHLPSLPQLIKENYNTTLWITDKIGNIIIKRNDNVRSWRQNLALFNSLENNVYSCSQFVSKQIFFNYKIKTKVISPYIQPKNLNECNGNVILYNKKPYFFDKLLNIANDFEFKKLENYCDFENAIAYLHFFNQMEYFNVELPIASSYGIPCLIENSECLNEYVTVGDILVNYNANESIWINNFKILLRDKRILSNKIKEFSNKYSDMSEIEKKIKLALKNTTNSKQMNFQEIQNFVKGKTLKSRKKIQKPPTKKIISPYPVTVGVPRVNEESVRKFLDENENIYFGCGGLGDAVLTIASCYNDKNASVIFGSSNNSVEEFFECFKIPTLITPNFYPVSVGGRNLFNFIKSHKNFKSSGHIPDNVNYLEWITKSDYYLSKLSKHLPFIDMFGKIINPRKTNSIVGICPRGSDHNNTNYQRWLTVNEFKSLVKKLLEEKNTVFAFGSTLDVNYYGTIEDNNFIWATSNFGLSYPAPKYPSSFKHMLSMINSCKLVYSVDTWMKTYTALAKIPTKVILSRNNGVVIKPPSNGSDYIFLNQKYWNLEFVDIKEII